MPGLAEIAVRFPAYDRSVLISYHCLRFRSHVIIFFRKDELNVRLLSVDHCTIIPKDYPNWWQEMTEAREKLHKDKLAPDSHRSAIGQASAIKRNESSWQMAWELYDVSKEKNNRYGTQRIQRRHGQAFLLVCRIPKSGSAARQRENDD